MRIVLRNVAPEGTIIRNIRNNEETDTIDIIVKNPKFPIINEGELIPSLNPPFELMRIEQYDRYLLNKLKE